MVTHGIKVKQVGISDMPKKDLQAALKSAKKTRGRVRANIASDRLPDVPTFISSNI